MAARRTHRHTDGSTTGQIGIQDPFQLVRHLARSQSDPRKAVAELIQNALDEQAHSVVIERRREEREAVLSILDDGSGVLPELPRREALEAIARGIGQSRKRKLPFDERMRQAMLGQYGIGILGFWAIGHEFRMISRVADGETYALMLWEDSPKFEIAPAPAPLDRARTWTEVQVRRIHPAALSSTAAVRLSTYLSVELRGQIVRHGTSIRIIDRLARGNAEREVQVRPSELAGERIEEIAPVQVPGFEHPIELHLYYAPEAPAGGPRVRLACAGAIVLDDLSFDERFAREPWTDSRLTGIVDFPHFEVPPGSRRGYVPNDAAHAFAEALAAVEPAIMDQLAMRSRAEADRMSVDMHRQLAKLFSRATEYVPHLEWFPVARSAGLAAGEDEADPGARVTEASRRLTTVGEQAEMFPPGPLASLRIAPARVEVVVGTVRRVSARAYDDAGRAIDADEVRFEWSCEGPLSVAPGDTGASANVRADRDVRAAQLRCVATREGRSAVAIADVQVISEPRPKQREAGIPQPIEVNDPLGSWRSRSVGDHWEVNIGHADYRALAGDARRRLRYAAHLLAKEIISRNFPRPEVGSILEEMVGLLAALERTGAWGRG